jgi:alpha-glucosidase
MILLKGTRMHEVWVDGPEHEAIRRRYTEERYRLMPYLYTVAEETSHDGLPIDRPLFIEFPHAIENGTPFDITTGGSEFLFGSRILVAPNPSPEEIARYTVYLPRAHGTTTGLASVLQVANPAVRLIWSSVTR